MERSEFRLFQEKKRDHEHTLSEDCAGHMKEPGNDPVCLDHSKQVEKCKK